MKEPRELQNRQTRGMWLRFLQMLAEQKAHMGIGVSNYLLFTCSREGHHVVVNQYEQFASVGTCSMDQALEFCQQPTKDGELRIVVASLEDVHPVLLIGDGPSSVMWCCTALGPESNFVLKTANESDLAIIKPIFFTVQPLVDEATKVLNSAVQNVGLTGEEAQALTDAFEVLKEAHLEISSAALRAGLRMMRRVSMPLVTVIDDIEVERSKAREACDLLNTLRLEHKKELDRLRSQMQETEGKLRGQLAVAQSELARLHASGIRASALKGSMEEALRAAYGQGSMQQ